MTRILRSSAVHFAAGMILTATIPGAAFAQDASEAQSGEDRLGEIIVTARRIEENLQSTPVAVTVFTGEEIEERNLRTVTDLALSTPNLVLQTSGVNGSSRTPAIFLRGLGQADTVLTADPAVGIYVDGVYIARNVGSILDLIDLERIEVLRGPQGTLFGKNTIGGAISLISRRPEPEFGATAELTAGNYSRVTGRGMVNLPVSETLFARFTGFFNSQDGYIRLANYPGREYGDDNTWGVRGQLRWQPSAALSVDFAADYSSTDNTGAPNVLLGTYPGSLAGTFYNAFFSGDPACNTPAGQATIPACFGPVQVPTDPYVSNVVFTSRTLARVPPQNRFNVFGANLTVSLDLPFGQLRSISAYRNLRSDYSFEVGPIGALYFESLADRQDSDQYSQEFQLIGSSFADRLRWIVGAYYLSESTFGHVDVLSAAARAPFLGTTYPLLTDNEQPTDTRNFAAYGQGTFDITQSLHLTAGLRWTYENKKSTLFLRPARPQGLEGELTVRRATPLLAISADLGPGILGYFSYSEGFRSGGFPPRVIGQVSIIPSFGPESATAFEAGLKTTLFDNRLRANLAVFTTSYEDFQGPGTRLDLNPPFGTVINAGDARIQGVELELAAAPSRNLQINATLSHLNSRLTRVDPTLNEGGVPVPVGSRLPYSPAWKATTGFEWTFPFSNGSELSTRAEIALTSRIYFALLNDNETSQASTVLVNGGVTYRFAGGHWELGVGARNITDSFYFTAKGRDRQTTGTLTGILGPPRSWFAILRWRY